MPVDLALLTVLIPGLSRGDDEEYQVYKIAKGRRVDKKKGSGRGQKPEERWDKVTRKDLDPEDNWVAEGERSATGLVRSLERAMQMECAVVPVVVSAQFRFPALSFYEGLLKFTPGLAVDIGRVALRRCVHDFGQMLQVSMLSGEAVTSIAVEEVHDVRGLKQHLTQLHGLPPRFRQRVFFHGENLEDDVKLDSPMDLDLVLLTFADVSAEQVEELTAVAGRGSVSEVRSSETVYMHDPVCRTWCLGLPE
ncbi:Kidins220 [Symbiodinium sp. KB8]|nr:Kidins220 [Symbiodinium sp. KB8]